MPQNINKGCQIQNEEPSPRGESSQGRRQENVDFKYQGRNTHERGNLNNILVKRDLQLMPNFRK